MRRRERHQWAMQAAKQGFVGSPSPHVVFEQSMAVLKEANKRGEGVWICRCINPHAPMPKYHRLDERNCARCGAVNPEAEEE